MKQTKINLIKDMQDLYVVMYDIYEKAFLKT